jgi:hypothetical protein
MAFLALLDWILALHIVPQIWYLGFSHLREEGSLDYDRGFVRLQIHMKFDMNIHRQQAPFYGAIAGEQAIKIRSSKNSSVFLLIFFCIS